MSLLMKALEKAAKDRGEARPEQPEPALTKATDGPLPGEPGAEPIPGAVGLTPELTLEPLVPNAHPAESSPRTPRGTGAHPERGQGHARAAGRPPPEQGRAATVLQAASRQHVGVGAYIRTHPMAAFAGLAALFAIGFGTYLYLQIFHPTIFIQRAPAPTTPPPLAQAPTPAPAVPLPGQEVKLLPSTPLLRQSTAPAAAPHAAPRPEAISLPDTAPATKSAPTRPQGTAQAPERPAQAVAPRSNIVVSVGSPAARVSPLLAEGYAALTAHRLDAARELYGRLLKAEPRNIDALLGLAAIALQEGKSDEAMQHYLRILDLDPRNALAQSGLIALLGRADPLAAESRLKQLISREPSGHLYFTLGNLYADQSLWAQAQQTYFQAFHLDPANSDYAYNVAVGLEHVGQRKLALGFYQRAVELAATRPHVNFDLARARERVTKLTASAE